MATTNPMTPIDSFALSVTATTANAILGTENAATNVQMRLQNAGTKTLYWCTGSSTVTATVATSTAAKTCHPLAAGAIEVFSKPGVDTYIAAICGGTDTSTLFVTIGRGL